MTGKDYLSQEEIDALLQQSSDDIDSDTKEMDVDDYLTSMERDALGEIGNITFGSAATALSTLLGKKVEITTPKVSIVEKEQLGNEFPEPHVAVHVKYVDGFEGINLLVIQTKDASVIADLMLGGDGTNVSEPLDEIHISAVQEAMNQMMGSSATSMSTIFNRFVNISPPGIDVLDFNDAEHSSIPQEEILVKVSFRLTIGDLIDSSIMQLLPLPFAGEMVNSLLGAATSEADVTEQQPPSSPPVETEQEIAATAEAPAAPPPSAASQQPPPRNYEQQQAYTQPAASFGGINQNRDIHVQPAQYTNFGEAPSVVAEDPNLNMLLDIPLRVTVELGRTQKLIKDILELSQGSIIELDKLAGEPVDILVNNTLIAKGEVVVIDENFGVRVTDIISQSDRIHRLQ